MKELRFHGTKIIEGLGSLKALEELSYQRAMIITGGNSLFKNGTIQRIFYYLGVHETVCPQGEWEAEGGKRLSLYSGITKNPTVGEVIKVSQVAKAFAPDLVLAVGGGSPMDVAKVVALLCEYPELDMATIRETKLPNKRETIMLVAIPSTSGSASEVTRASVFTFEEKHLKLSVKTDAIRPDIAILDGEITLSMPKNVIAETGMDALTHAIECYINKTSDDFTQVLAKGAVEGILSWLPKSWSYGTENTEANQIAKQKMHNYQCMSGMAFANAGLGMAHGISHAFGGRYNLGHGLLNAIILPYAMEFNAQDKETAKRLQELTLAVGGDIVQKVKDLRLSLGIPTRISDCGVDNSVFEADLEELLEGAMQGSTLANPIKVTREEMRTMLQRVFYG